MGCHWTERRCHFQISYLFPQNGAVGVEVWTCFLFQLGWHQEQCELAPLEKEGGGQECFYVEGLLKRSIFVVVKYNMPIEDP